MRNDHSLLRLEDVDVLLKVRNLLGHVRVAEALPRSLLLPHQLVPVALDLLSKILLCLSFHSALTDLCLSVSDILSQSEDLFVLELDVLVGTFLNVLFGCGSFFLRGLKFDYFLVELFDFVLQVLDFSLVLSEDGRFRDWFLGI